MIKTTRRLAAGLALLLGVSAALPAQAGEAQYGYEDLFSLIKEAAGTEGFSGELNIEIRSGEMTHRENMLLAGTEESKAIAVKNTEDTLYDALILDTGGLYLNVGGIAMDGAARLNADEETKAQLPVLLQLVGMNTDWLFIPGLITKEEMSELIGLAEEILADVSPVLEGVPLIAGENSWRVELLFSELDPVAGSLWDICRENAGDWAVEGLKSLDRLDVVSMLKPYADAVMEKLETDREQQEAFYGELESYDSEKLLALAGGEDKLREQAEAFFAPRDEAAEPFAGLFAGDESRITFSAEKAQENYRFCLEITLSEKINQALTEAAEEGTELLPEMGEVDASAWLMNLITGTEGELSFRVEIRLRPDEVQIALPEETTNAAAVAGAVASFLKSAGFIGNTGNPNDTLQEGVEVGSFIISSGERNFLISFDDAAFVRDPEFSADYITYLDYTEPEEGFLAVVASESNSFDAFLTADTGYFLNSGTYENVVVGEKETLTAPCGYALSFCTLDYDSQGVHSSKLYFGLEAEGCLFSGIVELSSPEAAETMKEMAGRIFLQVTEETGKD